MRSPARRPSMPMTYTSSSYSSGISETVLLLVWLFSSCMVKE